MTLAEFQAVLTRTSTTTMPAAVTGALTSAGLGMERAAKLNATTRPRVRTGRLRASIASSVTADAKGYRLSMSAGGVGGRGEVNYARLQEEGGTVTAPGGGYLRIPLAPALTGAGVDRYPGPLRIVAPGLFRVVPLRGRLFLEKVSGPGAGKFWYVLKKSVTVPATKFLSSAFEAGLPDVERRLGVAVLAALTDSPTSATGGAPDAL